jgi:rod shape-determining protein MreD
VKAARVSFVLFFTLVLQTTLFSDLVVFGVRADVVLLFAVAAGIVGGPDKGAVGGFVAGLGYDLLVVGTPVGLYALSYCITGYVIGTLQGGVMRASWWIPIVSAIGASALGVSLFALIGTVLGEEGLLEPQLLRIAAVVAVVNGALVVPALRVARWAAPPERRARLA